MYFDTFSTFTTPAAGLCYKHGTGVAKDEAEGARLFTLAANQGHAQAQFNLGEYETYDNGLAQQQRCL
jgi:TPR repeat protein